MCTGINSEGVVAGSDGYDAVIFESGRMRLLGNLGGFCLSEGLNDHKVVVGQSERSWTYPTTVSGFIWTEAEGLIDLNLLIDTNSGWYISRAWGINQWGQIACEGGVTKAVGVRLDPIPPVLLLEQAGTNVVVSWQPAWPGLALEATDNLSSTNWQAIPTGGRSQVSLPKTGSQRFFRLNLAGAAGLCCAPQ